MGERSRTAPLIQGFEFAALAYSYHAIARLIDCGWDHKKVQRTLNKGGVFARPDGLVWLSDIKAHMPHFLDSLFELKHQKELAKLRSPHEKRIRPIRLPNEFE